MEILERIELLEGQMQTVKEVLSKIADMLEQLI